MREGMADRSLILAGGVRFRSLEELKNVPYMGGILGKKKVLCWHVVESKRLWGVTGDINPPCRWAGGQTG